MSARVYMIWKKLPGDEVTPGGNEDHDISYCYMKSRSNRYFRDNTTEMERGGVSIKRLIEAVTSGDGKRGKQSERADVSDEIRNWGRDLNEGNSIKHRDAKETLNGKIKTKKKSLQPGRTGTSFHRH